MFCCLLGKPEHGRWLIAPEMGAPRVTRRYRPNTLILETRFETDEGAATLIDFMPPRKEHSQLIRIVRGESGKVNFRSELILRFAYGAIVPWMTRVDDTTLRAIAGPDMAVLRSSRGCAARISRPSVSSSSRAGEEVPFVLSFAPLASEPPPEPVDVVEALAATEQFWTGWAGRDKIEGPWDEAVTRSLIVLKALTYAPTGGMAAAPTTSLPECIGGSRNWDYRFCWLRDATMTLLALMNAGYL